MRAGRAGHSSERRTLGSQRNVNRSPALKAHPCANPQTQGRDLCHERAVASEWPLGCS
jgi:hypothetical protein